MRRSRLRSLMTEVGSNDKQTLSLQQRMAITRQGMAEQELLKTQADLKHAMAEFKVLEEKARRTARSNRRKRPLHQQTTISSGPSREIRSCKATMGARRIEEHRSGCHADCDGIRRIPRS